MNLKAFTYDMGEFRDLNLEFEPDVDITTQFPNWGFEPYAILAFGDEDYFGVKVYGSSDEDIGSRKTYLVEVDLGDRYEFVEVGAFPSLLHFLNNVVPLTKAAIDQISFDDEEDKKNTLFRQKK